VQPFAAIVIVVVAIALRRDSRDAVCPGAHRSSWHRLDSGATGRWRDGRPARPAR
jgi:hypothetical protein